MLDDLSNMPGIAEWVRRTDLIAFWEGAVLADWRGSTLIPPDCPEVLAHIADASARGKIFSNI